MSQTFPKPAYRADYTCLIWHPLQAKILMLESGLPVLTSPESVYSAPFRVHDQILEHVNLEVRVLRRIGFERDIAANHAWMAFELELVGDANAIPINSYWLAEHEIDRLPLENQRQLVQTVFLEAQQPPALRPSWARRGWWHDALIWIDGVLEAHNASRISFKSLKTWQISSLSQIETTLGCLYFKAVPPFFAREPGVTSVLGQFAPEHTPEIVAINLERDWMLMKDFGDEALTEKTRLEQVRSALSDYAKLQIKSLEHLAPLRAAGCQHRSLEALALEIHDLLWDETLLLRDQEDGLSSAQIKRLRELEPEFVRRCKTLSKLGIPDMLEHGDLWRNNVNFCHGRTVFYDWTDAAIAFPLQSVPLSELEPEVWGSDARETLTEAYLEPFTVFAPMLVLKAAFNLVQPLIELYRAVNYRRFIIPGTEDKKESQAGLIWLLGNALNIMGAVEVIA